MHLVTITYDHPERGEEVRVVTPSHLFVGHSPHHPDAKDPAYYLQAFCQDRKSNRHFPMSRIRSWQEGNVRSDASHEDQ